ncbi:MAG: hypothetical protein R2688_08545 [Fimbriimonadaceae bacterium]
MSAQKSKNSDSQAMRKPAALWKIVIRRIVFDILLANLALAVSWALIWNYPGENSVFEALFYGHLPITIVAGLLLVARRFTEFQRDTLASLTLWSTCRLCRWAQRRWQ